MTHPWEKLPIQEPDYDEIPDFLKRELPKPVNHEGNLQDSDLIALQLWGPKI
jgi:hypothetical protein